MQREGAIYIGLGANLPFGDRAPAETLASAIASLSRRGVRVLRQSRLWRSAPVPVSDQPWFVNAVIAVETDLSPSALLAMLHEIEAEFGRVRSAPDGARTLDLDLLDYQGLVQTGGRGAPVLPHPRMHQRAFVLRPLLEIAPAWRHPALGTSGDELLVREARKQEMFPISEP